VDSIQRGTGCSIDGPATNITAIDLYTGGPSTGGFYVYFDAFDFSWTPGYYLNRNMFVPGFANYSMSLIGGTQQDGYWTYTITNYPVNKSICYRILVVDNLGNWNATGYYNFRASHIISYSVPSTLTIKVDIGKGASRKADITFYFRNTGDTTMKNINFTIMTPSGWITKPSINFVTQLAPGQNISVTFKIPLPKNVTELIEIVTIDVSAIIPELGIKWTIPHPIEVFISKFKVDDIYIWIIIIIGSACAAVSTTYVYIHRRSSRQQVPTPKIKGKSTVSLSNALRADIPGSLTVISVEIMEQIESLPGITNDEKGLINQYISQLDEEEVVKFLEELKKTKLD
jgi:hypothetical protein